MTYRYAELADVRSFAAGLADAQLECRALGQHAWMNRVRTALKHTTTNRYTCGNCGPTLTVIAYDTGALETRTTRYAEGYLAPAGTGHIVGTGRDVLRREQMVRDGLIASVTPIKRRRRA